MKQKEGWYGKLPCNVFIFSNKAKIEIDILRTISQH